MQDHTHAFGCTTIQAQACDGTTGCYTTSLSSALSHRPSTALQLGHHHHHQQQRASSRKARCCLGSRTRDSSRQAKQRIRPHQRTSSHAVIFPGPSGSRLQFGASRWLVCKHGRVGEPVAASIRNRTPACHSTPVQLDCRLGD